MTQTQSVYLPCTHQLTSHVFTKGDHRRLLQRGPGVSWEFQWRLAVGCGLGAGYKPLARYADISRCRYDPEFFVIEEWLIRVRVGRRKNLQFESTWLYIACPQDPGEVSLFHALCLAHRVFEGRGNIMPHVDDTGRVGRDRPMSYPGYV